MGGAMNRWTTCSALVACTGFITVSLFSTPSFAATCEQAIAKAMSVEGKVDVRHTDETQWSPVKLNDTFCPGDVIRVQERSRADIALTNQPMLRLDQNTTMTLGGVKPSGSSIIELVKGATHFFSRQPRNLEVRTAFVNAGVEGTEGVVRVTDDNAEVIIFDGKVVAKNEAGTVNVTDGQSVIVEKGKAPSYQTVLKPRDAVQWALYYPPVMDVAPDGVVKEDDPRSLARRAARSLSVGRVDEAKVDLDRALKLDPKNGDALALQSVKALVQNDKGKAIALAQEAVAADPSSTAATTALSYAQQANFDLEGARKTLEDEVKAHPNNALAWARLAELRGSFSDLDGALEAAEKAVAINSNISRTQTVLGFAHLLRIDLDEAKAAFGKAIELDQSDAMPRLGLGLAKFREGDVEEGRREMEVAASLDPNNAMIRSYLGKAYFEEKRDKLTEREYKNAKELDPKDPTAYFYDAIQKQLTNRPVEALHDMETAKELNENRGIYRSRLQLDSDLAARSASLARIYINLGFEYLALVEGWTAINRDPTSFTAARFLADTYATLPRHQIARVSELLRSQLLQPLNITPIQPTLAESNLFLIASLGPTATSFNEFNTLMVNRNRITSLSTGLVGSFNTFGVEQIAAGIYDKVSFSAGISLFDTDGWRTNANQNEQLGNIFLQYELSPSTSLQGEYRHRRSDLGDLQLNFFPDDFRTNFNRLVTTDSYRVGARHNLAPNSTLLGSFMYQHRDAVDNDVPPVFFINSLKDSFPNQDAYGGELQHLFTSNYFNLVSGFGQFNIRSNNDFTADTIFGLFPSTTNQNTQHSNLYMYSYLKPWRQFTLTAGASWDLVYTKVSGVDDTRNQVNPKVGFIWNVLPNTIFRFAAFRTLKRTLLTDQTLEPTQVAGFNQFYDDVNSTSSWRYSAAINQTFTKNVWGGFELSKRDLNSPVLDTLATNTILHGDWTEYNARAYLFATPHDWVSVGAEFQYEKLKISGPDSTAGNLLVNGLFFQDVETYRVPLGLRIFHPSGLSASLRYNWWYQTGDFQRRGVGTVESGQDHFSTVDAGISYRLPKRYGLLTVGASNLFDQHFNYQSTDINNPIIQPSRFVFAQLTLALP
jgi:tetratricopeptide (TPR) repeat protein